MRRILSGVLLLLLFTACGGGDSKKEKAMAKEAKGPVNYGGVFRFNEVSDFRDLYPLSITEVVSHRIANQVYEGLVKLDQKTLEVEPALAKRYEVNEDATKFTFYLRKGVMFHDDECFEKGKGREVTAQDFKYCFEKLCESSPRNQVYWLFKDRVKGAEEYHQSSMDGDPLEKGVTGIKVIDDHTLQIELEYPFSGFPKILAHSGCYVFPKEAVEMYGVDMRVNAVGTGPFKIKKVKEGEVVILERNDNYWAIDQYGNQLPYLDALKVTFVKEKKSELLQFKKDHLDMVYRLPVDMIGEVTNNLANVKKQKANKVPYQIQSSPSLSIQYYGFQHKSELFSDKNLRKAFNYAIDREKITTFTLQGEGLPAHHGVVPPVLKSYPAEKVEGYIFNPEKASEYMAKAGFPGGKGFPELTLQLNSGGSINVQVAEAIQKMLEDNLGINIELDVMPFAQHLERVETGKTLFWRAGWLADYPSPENFLSLYYGKHVPDDLNKKSYINSVRYQSAEYDSLFEAALRETDEQKRMKLFQKADQKATDDAVVIPLYYDENVRLLQHRIKNFPMNPMEYRDFSDVYFSKKEKEKAS